MNGFDRIDVWDKSPRGLISLLREHGTELLWIQYSGYGFGYQGVPRFLIRALELLQPRPKVVVYFHETHCEPHQLGWKGLALAPLQKRISRKLANLSDHVFTSNELYRRSIEVDYGVPSERITLLPLGSNISVPRLTPRQRAEWRSKLGWSSRDRVAVAFGSASGQRRALQRHQQWLLGAIEADAVTHVVCVGGESGTRRDEELLGIDDKIVRASTVMGHQSPEGVGKTLIAADVALTGYPFERFGKSGVIMAYSLAGLPIVVGTDRPPGVDTFRGARLVGTNGLGEFHSVVNDLDARLVRQQEAATKYSWSAIARSAFNTIGSICPPKYRMRKTVGATA